MESTDQTPDSSTKPVPEGYKVLTEGKANILYHVKADSGQKDTEMAKEDSKPKNNKKKKAQKMKKEEKDQDRDAVFYNPVQEFNRDLSILCITEHGDRLMKEREQSKEGWTGIKVLEALAATGLRSVRYMKEIGVHVKKITANDWDPEASKLITKNFEFNDIPLEKAEIRAMDGIDLMYEKRKDKDFYDVVDLDPYGTAVPFLDSSVQAIEDGGLLCVTFTDMAVLCANKPHACFYKYDAVTTHKKNCHEFALRMVLHTIASVANRYAKQIIPMLSLTADHYIRLFIKIVKKPILCHDTFVNTSLVFQCSGCQAFHLHAIGKESSRKRQKVNEDDAEETKNEPKEKQAKRDHQHNTKYSINMFSGSEKCTVCDSSYIIGGPIWNAEIHDIDFINSLSERVEDWKHLTTYNRIKITLDAIKKEMSIGNYPLNFEFDRVISEIKSESIPKKYIFAAFASLGYKLTQTYYNPMLYKTDAPHEAIYDIFKAWKQKKLEGKDREISDKCLGTSLSITSKPIEHKPDFDYDIPDIKKNKLKYNQNPANWGPMRAAASGNTKKSKKKADEKKAEEK